MLYYTTYFLTCVSIIYIYRIKTITDCFPCLLGLSLWNIPVIMLGNSSSAGIFPTDIASFFILFKLLFLKNKKITILIKNNSSVFFFLLIVTYIVIRVLIVLFFAEYGYFDRFFIYGAYRWITYLFFIILFLQDIDHANSIKILNSIIYILIIYFILAILHQQSVIDISGFEITGHADIYEKDWLITDLRRTVLGNNPATVGFVSSFSFFFAILIQNHLKKKKGAWALLFLSIISLLGSFSRTDAIALIVSYVIVSMLFKNSNMKQVFFKKIIPISIILIPLILSIYQLSIGNITDLPVIARLIKTDYIGEYQGASSGTLAYRIMHWQMAIEYLYQNSNIALFGFGPNGYRMLVENGIGTMGFGHNTYIHNWVELGIWGSILLLIWIVKILRIIKQNIKHKNGFISDLNILSMLILIHRLIAGYSVDTLFAVDNALTMNLFMLFSICFPMAIVFSSTFKNQERLKNNEKI